MGRTNHIFIDFENVQEADFDRIAGKDVKVVLVLGKQQKSLPVSLVKKLLKYSAQVELVEVDSSGRNALDLVLAQKVGEAKICDPQGYFHIVSKDKGFDAQIAHLRQTGTLAARHAGFFDIPLLMNHAERVQYAVKQLASIGRTRPAKQSTLATQMQQLFGKSLSMDEVSALIQALTKQQVINISTTGAVTYPNQLS
ncbi:MAG: PIN domain-containing protein [Verrucomicrobia bacterium]|nr:PIN domain-containing protein [Verrucomicrobiota bacterium]